MTAPGGVKNVGDVQATLNVKAHECGSGLWLGHDNVVATGLTAANNADGDGIYLTGNNAQITGIRATGNGGTGIHVTGTGGAGVSWLAPERPVNDVWFSSTASGWVVTGLLAGHNPCWLGPTDQPSDPVAQGRSGPVHRCPGPAAEHRRLHPAEVTRRGRDSEEDPHRGHRGRGPPPAARSSPPPPLTRTSSPRTGHLSDLVPIIVPDGWSLQGAGSARRSSKRRRVHPGR